MAHIIKSYKTKRAPVNFESYNSYKPLYEYKLPDGRIAVVRDKPQPNPRQLTPNPKVAFGNNRVRRF